MYWKDYRNMTSTPSKFGPTDSDGSLYRTIKIFWSIWFIVVKTRWLVKVEYSIKSLWRQTNRQRIRLFFFQISFYILSEEVDRRTLLILYNLNQIGHEIFWAKLSFLVSTCNFSLFTRSKIKMATLLCTT